MRAPSSSDFPVPVEGVGDFIFGKRSMRDEFAIQVEYRKLTGGMDDPGNYLHLVGTWMSTLKVLMVSAPEKYADLDSLDPLDPDTYLALGRIFDALSAKEGSFRRKPAATVP